MKVGVGHRRHHVRHVRGRGDPGGPAPPRRHRPRASTIDAALLDTPGRLAGQRGHQLPAVRARCRPARAPSTPTSSPTRRSRARDGFVILAVGNDAQFQKWCALRRLPPSSPADPRFATNSLRVQHRRALYALMPAFMRAKTTAEWVDGPGRPRRALRAGQHPGPGVRRPAGAGARHADRPAAPQRRRGLRSRWSPTRSR